MATQELTSQSSNGPLTSNSRIIAAVGGVSDPTLEPISPDLLHDFIKARTDALYPTQSELSSLDDYVMAFTLRKGATDNTKWDGQDLIARGFAAATAPTDLVVYQQLQDAVLSTTFDIPGLTVIDTVNSTDDLLLIYDTSFGGYKSATPNQLIGGLDPDLGAIAALSGTGFGARTADDTWALRSLTEPAAGLTIANPAGVAGNPTFALANDLAALEALSGTNTIYYRSAADTWTAVTIGGMLSFSGGTLNVGDAELTAIAGLTSASNRIPYFTGSGTAALLTLDTDGTFAANSDTVLASQKAVKTYVDQIIAAQDAMVFKGVIDCSANPNYPAADRGHTYRVSVAGKIGGGSGTNVEAGDILICLTDGTSAGTQAAVGASWSITQTNLDGAVIGPASATDSHFAQFDGTTGKLIKGGLSLDTDGTLSANSATRIPSQSAVKTYAQPLDATLTSLAGVSTSADKLIYASGSDTFTTTDLTSFARTLLDDTDATAMRSTLGLVIGTNVQAYDAELAALAGLTSAADKIPYFTGSATASTADFTASGRAMVAAASAAAQTALLSAFTGDSGSGGVKGLVPAPASGDTAANKFLKADGTWTAPSGSGDVSGGSASTDGEVVLYSGTGGKTIKRSNTISGIAKLASGVLSAAASGTDYAPATSGSSVLKGNGSGGFSSAAATDLGAGTHTIYVPAAAMLSRTTNGAASGTVETTTNKVMIRTLDFDTSTQEFAQFSIRMPKSWNEGTVTASFTWSHASTTTNFGVVWALEGVALSDGDALDAAFGTAQQVADTGGTTNTTYITAATSAITIAGSPAAEDWVVFQVKRVPADGSDTMAIDARLHGVTVYITTDAITDA